MADDLKPHYDSFVIRLWHTRTNDQLLRAEIAHVQTEAVYVGRDVNLEWIGDTVKRAVSGQAIWEGDAEPATDDARE